MTPSDDSKAVARLLDDIAAVWAPHPGQKEIISAVFSGKYRIIFVECGRQWGKSELAAALGWMWALFNPRSSIYYLGPKQKQAGEIIWAPNRLQTLNSSTSPDFKRINTFTKRCAPYVKQANKSEMRLTFINDSFIKVDGSDNYDDLRGIQPSLLILDEFRNFRPAAFEVLEASTTTRGAPIVIVSTPAHVKGFYTDLQQLCKNKGALGDGTMPELIYFNRPTDTNPYQNMDRLASLEQQYIERGEEDVWQREYMARFVTGGARAVFPMFEQDSIKQHSVVMDGLEMHDFSTDWYCVVDPGYSKKKSGSAFAVLFAAINRFTKRVSILDEIYLTGDVHRSTGVVEPLIRNAMQNLRPGSSLEDWYFYYDEAAPGFAQEMQDRGYAFMPTNKKLKTKEEGLSLVKDAFLSHKVDFSDNCDNLAYEMFNYIRNERHQIENKDDHLIDCFRYLLMMANYHITNRRPGPGRVGEQPTEGRRWVSVTDDLKEWGADVLADSDDNEIFW